MADMDDPEQKRLTAVHNERTKLRATYLNGVALAVFAIGGFAPVFSYLSQVSNAHYGLIGGLGGVVC